MRGHTAFRSRQFHMLKLKWGTEGKKELRMRPMQACLSLSPSYLERKGDSSHQCLKKSPNNLQFMVWLSRLFRSCSPIPDIESSASDRHPGTATNIFRMHRVIVLQCHLFWFSHQFYEVTILLSSFLYRWGDWGLEKLQGNCSAVDLQVSISGPDLAPQFQATHPTTYLLDTSTWMVRRHFKLSQAKGL